MMQELRFSPCEGGVRGGVELIKTNVTSPNLPFSGEEPENT